MTHADHDAASVSESRVSLAISLAAILVIYFLRSPWTSAVVPVVWLGAYCFGWYEGKADRA